VTNAISIAQAMLKMPSWASAGHDSGFESSPGRLRVVRHNILVGTV
jgi:hypothetical protein